ncbi:short-chain dehydrogenase [Brevibacillus choshinensis]|uniref:Short-chain dehydrogenase n=1 Tax=Brevibacillus choshinensis TaxID=54911 RepID=A0ABR5N879_BRECH|nr:SDR family NAD(P)-dependent oxidoreductase [Brevibacillus choshinensis]KQL46821.1 short-chain dehydrogenase [Brevibacillus choshinensis]
MNRLQNKVAIITGAGSGMGREEALLFASEGAKVVVTDIQEEKVHQVVAEIKENGGEAIGLYHNVTSEENWVKVVEEAVETFGKVDVLVNNAGIPSQSMPLHEFTLEAWNRTMDINLNGTFLGMKHVLPVMLENKGGSIVNISSIAGLTGGSGASAYTASKGAVRMLTKGTAIQYAKQNIRCNSVHPGFIETPMTTDMFANDEMTKWFHSLTPLPRLGKARDVAEGVLFLASDASSFITGIELPVDGGYSAQ